MLPTSTQLRGRFKFRCDVLPNTRAVYCYLILVPNNAAVAAVSHGGLLTCSQGQLPNRSCFTQPSAIVVSQDVRREVAGARGLGPNGNNRVSVLYVSLHYSE